MDRLKGCYYLKEKPADNYLQSSMDRLKAQEQIKIATDKNIYNPVWID